MSKEQIDDGGLAFPLDVSKGDNWTFNTGMSLRMWLAGQTMAAFVNSLASMNQKPEKDDEQYVARIALRFADALIKESKSE